MKVNKDPKVIVMDIEMFARLLKYAEVGKDWTSEHQFGSSIKEIKQHVNRKNLVLREAKARHEEEQRRVRHTARQARRRFHQVVSLRNQCDLYYASANDRKLYKIEVQSLKQYDAPHLPDYSAGYYSSGSYHSVRIEDLHIDHPKFESEYIAYLLNVEGYTKSESTGNQAAVGVADS